MLKHLATPLRERSKARRQRATIPGTSRRAEELAALQDAGLSGQGAQTARRILWWLLGILGDKETLAEFADCDASPVLLCPATAKVSRATASACWAQLRAGLPEIFGEGLHLQRFLAFAVERAREHSINPLILRTCWVQDYRYKGKPIGSTMPETAMCEVQGVASTTSPDGAEVKISGASIEAPIDERGRRFNDTAPRGHEELRMLPAPLGWHDEAAGGQKGAATLSWHGATTEESKGASAALAGKKVGQAPASSAGAEEAQPSPEAVTGHDPACKGAGTTGSTVVLTRSHWILGVRALRSFWSLRTAALLLDDERAMGCPWSDHGSCSVVVRRLLEAQAARVQGAKALVKPPRVGRWHVANYARGLAALQGAALVQTSGDAWWQPEVDADADAGSMPDAGEDGLQLALVSWMSSLPAPQKPERRVMRFAEAEVSQWVEQVRAQSKRIGPRGVPALTFGSESQRRHEASPDELDGAALALNDLDEAAAWIAEDTEWGADPERRS